MNATSAPLISLMFDFVSVDLPTLYHELNRHYFEGQLPACSLKWSRRLTRTAGHIHVTRREITLSVPLLAEAWREETNFLVCGVPCESPEQALREILKHEMIHLWLYVNRQPHGHTPAFRDKARQIGQPKTRHSIALPQPKSGWVYSCPMCGITFARRRRYGRPVACAGCCKQHNNGNFDERFRLRGKKLKA